MPLFANETAFNSQQAPKARDVFDDIERSDGRAGGIYPIPGVYPVLYVDVVKMIRSRKGDDVFIAEFEILQSAVVDRPGGTKMSWAVNFRHDASPGNVKAFIAAVANVPQNAVDAQGCRRACSTENPLHGKLVRLEASMTKTHAGNDFTLCTWRPVPDELAKKAQELRDQVFGAPF